MKHVPPVLFASQITLPRKVLIMNLSYTGSGPSAVWDALTALMLYISGEVSNLRFNPTII
jgi:hypothetical protein